MHDDDSQEIVDGLTDKEDDSDVDVVGPTDIDDDDDNDDGPSPRLEHHVVGVSDMPCDPLEIQEEVKRMDEGDQVENVNVSFSEGGAKEHGRVRQGIKTKMIPLP